MKNKPCVNRLFCFHVLIFLLPGSLLWAGSSFPPIDPGSITIVRDHYGVPHIFAPTDATAAYGLAWAHSEDDFEHVQEALLAGKGMLGQVKGKDGVLFDFALQAFEIDSLVEARYKSDLSEDYRKVLSGYIQGVNDYAAAHPQEVWVEEALPFREQDAIKSYVVGTSLMAGLGKGLKAANDGRIEEYYFANEIGSNAVAVAPHKMADGKGYLLNNSHQPNEGRYAWYEAHVQSDEGWDIIGALFPGGSTLFVGTNRHLGWAHTTNYHNFGDIYQLEINKKNKKQYRYNGEWRTFREKKIKLKLKLGGIKLGVKKKAYWTVYGPALKTKYGWYAFRFPGYMDIRSAEQWYRMNKATNFEEFEAAVKMQAIPLFNIVYADREGNTYFHSGGRIAKRDPKLDWSQPIQSDSPEYLWQDILPYAQMPVDLNPDCGYVYNANNTPLHCTGDSCQWVGDFPGLQMFEYNRGEVFGEALKDRKGKFTTDFLDSLKFNSSYAPDGTYMSHFKALYELDEAKYPELAEAIQKMKNWDLRGNADNKDAALAMITHDFLRLKCDCPFALLMIREEPLSEEDAEWALREAAWFLKKKHGTLDVPLGEVQRLVRGDESWPADGLREVPRAAPTKKWENGQYRVTGGDGYIHIARFSKDGPEIVSVSPFGASQDPNSPHHTDQMELFSKHQYKPMTFDKAKIFQQAERVYHPGE